LPERLRPQRIGDKIHKASNVICHGSAPELYQALVSLWQHPETVVIGGRPQPAD
jgi:hypothetical protein